MGFLLVREDWDGLNMPNSIPPMPLSKGGDDIMAPPFVFCSHFYCFYCLLFDPLLQIVILYCTKVFSRMLPN